jgi:hypothetical protein
MIQQTILFNGFIASFAHLETPLASPESIREFFLIGRKGLTLFELFVGETSQISAIRIS